MADSPLLLALPLKSGVIKASDPVLEAASSIFEWLALFFGVGVFVGVAAEVWLAWARFPETTRIGHWGPVYADILVAIGVGGEIWFAFRASRCQGELTQRAKKRLGEALTLAADATTRAARAEEALVRYRRPRFIKPSDKPAFVAKLAPFAGTDFDTGFARTEHEQVEFIWTLEDALRSAGWDQLAWTGGRIFRGTLEDHPPGTMGYRPESGEVDAYNVSIQVHAGRHGRFQSAIDALIGALADLDIDCQRDSFNIHNPNKDAIHIIVGSKV